MILHKLQLDDFDDIDYHLIAIHSNLEDYRMAFFLNKNLPILLSKSKKYLNINIKQNEVLVTKFEYMDNSTDRYWTLVSNKSEIITNQKSTSQNLFLDQEIETELKIFLLPELKKVDYLLKIQNTNQNFDLTKIISQINTIDQVSTVYEINPEKIKSKNNLIF